MSKTNFTPGDWTAECVGSGGSHDNPVDVYEITNGHARIAEYVYEHDAHLLAASKELYEACENALECLIGCCVPAGGCDDRKTMLDTQAMLRAALKKARNE